METKISFYKTSKDTTGADLSLIDFIRGIKDGAWQDEVFRVRAEKDPDKKRIIKTKCPGVTISGSFTKRKASELRKHSGFINIDIDGVHDPNSVKKMLSNDPYIYAAFDSIGGGGLCLLVRIDPERHLDAFNGIAKYLYDTYQIIVDQSGKDVSRLRFVSYDPYILINEDAILFKKYPPKPKRQKVNKIVYVESDLDRIITEMHSRGINVCEDYADWLGVCYALASEFGDTQTGRDYFHTLSSMSSKYNATDTDKQYDSCLKTLSASKKQSTIATIYHYAKINGIELYAKETRDVIRAAASQYKNGLDASAIAAGLKKYDDIDESQSMPIIEQVITKGIEHQSENIIEDIIYFLQPFNLRKNLVTRNVEMNGKPLDDSDINTLFIDCKSHFEKATKDLVCSVIFSNKIEQYNPILEFICEAEIDEEYPNLGSLLNSVKTDTPSASKWITKWLVSIVASAYGTYSPLQLVLSGERQGTGKTHWFRYLLPKKQRYLFAESEMDNGNDDAILMTKKLIILDDEYGGKSKREEKKLKKITSKEFINVREPYGRVSVDLRRISVFCGTSNDNQILTDPTGNRRVLPINVLDIDREAYNRCDKNELWKELYHLYKSGYDCTVLREDMEDLAKSTEYFEAKDPEEELLLSKLRPATNDFTGEFMTATDICKYLSADTKYTFNNRRMGLLLKKYGFTQQFKKTGSVKQRVYRVEKLTQDDISVSESPF